MFYKLPKSNEPIRKKSKKFYLNSVKYTINKILVITKIKVKHFHYIIETLQISI